MGQRLEQIIAQRYTMANKHVTRCSTSVVIWKMQVKTTMRFHFTHTRVAIIFLKGTVLVRMWRNRTLLRY